MLISVCKTCKGDGFWRQKAERVHPMQNAAYATKILSDGTRIPAVYRLSWYSSVHVVEYEFPCFKCRGVGEIQWSRGRSLTP